jgi:hypothetical protein
LLLKENQAGLKTNQDRLKAGHAGRWYKPAHCGGRRTDGA